MDKVAPQIINARNLVMNCKKILLSALGLLALAHVEAADIQWCMTTNKGDVIRMAEVSYILSLGKDAETFNIVKSDGTVIEGIGKVKFSQQDVTGIESVTMKGSDVLSQMVGNTLVISGVKAGEQIAVYSLSGAQMSVAVSCSDNAEVYVGSLPSGTYILRVGSTSVKFIKR